MLKRNVEIGQDQPVGHQRDDLIDMGVGIDIVEANPAVHRRHDLAQFAGEVGHVGDDLLPLPHARFAADVDAIGRGVLADHQQFLRPRLDQLFSLAQDRVGAAADQVAAQRRDDAEGAAMVAPLADLQIAVMARRELEPAVRHQIEERVGRHRCGVMDGADDFFILMRTCHRQHIGKAGTDRLGLLAHAAGDDDAAILRDGFADGIQAFFLGGIEKAAGVDQHDVGARIIGRHGIAVGAELGQDTLTVDQVLGTAERHHAHLGRFGKSRCHEARAHRGFCGKR